MNFVFSDNRPVSQASVAACQSVLAELVEAVMRGIPLLALTGPPGTGKTTLAHAIGQELESRSRRVVHVVRGEREQIDLRELTCELLEKAAEDFHAGDIETLFDVMSKGGAACQTKLVLIIDDAEVLGLDALGYLRLLANIAIETMPQIVFIGRPSFWDVTDPTRWAIQELITERWELAALSDIDSNSREMTGASLDAAAAQSSAMAKAAGQSTRAEVRQSREVRGTVYTSGKVRDVRRRRLIPMLGMAMAAAAACVAVYSELAGHDSELQARAGLLSKIEMPSVTASSAAQLEPASSVATGQVTPSSARTITPWPVEQALAHTIVDSDVAKAAASGDAVTAETDTAKPQVESSELPQMPAKTASPAPAPITQAGRLADTLDEALASYLPAPGIPRGRQDTDDTSEVLQIVVTPDHTLSPTTPAPTPRTQVQNNETTPPGALRVTASADPLPAGLALLSRGDAMLALGDIVAARLLYERAVELGDARAATSLGKTYDAGFLAAMQATGVIPDRALAASWYRIGAALGDGEGAHRLAVLAHQ